MTGRKALDLGLILREVDSQQEVEGKHLLTGHVGLRTPLISDLMLLIVVFAGVSQSHLNFRWQASQKVSEVALMLIRLLLDRIMFSEGLGNDSIRRAKCVAASTLRCVALCYWLLLLFDRWS